MAEHFPGGLAGPPIHSMLWNMGVVACPHPRQESLVDFQRKVFRSGKCKRVGQRADNMRYVNGQPNRRGNANILHDEYLHLAVNFVPW